MPVGLVADLVARDEVERLPKRQTCSLLGIEIPLIALDPFTDSAAAKLRLAVKMPLASMIGADDS